MMGPGNVGATDTIGDAFPVYGLRGWLSMMASPKVPTKVQFFALLSLFQDLPKIVSTVEVEQRKIHMVELERQSGVKGGASW